MRHSKCRARKGRGFESHTLRQKSNHPIGVAILFLRMKEFEPLFALRTSPQITFALLSVLPSHSQALEAKRPKGHEGVVPINASITYTDNEGQKPTFDNPLVDVKCDTVVYPEPCPDPVCIEVESCSDSVICSAGDTFLESLGRILQLDINIRNVCPGRRTALAVIVNELDEYGEEYPRGMKTITVPAHYKQDCSDVLVKCIRFVLPEDLNPSAGSCCSLCHERKFTVRTICNYIDTEFQCCSVSDPV